MIVDARGMKCPWPAIRLARALRARGGETIEVRADDPAAEREMGAVAHAAGGTLERVGEDRFRVLFPRPINGVFTIPG